MPGETDWDQALVSERVGDRLRSARNKAGLDLTDIAARTRIPLRHLTAIEAGDCHSLPSITYSVGFVKAFAKAVGEDPEAAARALRAELGQMTVQERWQPVLLDEEETGSVPSWRLVWGALALVVVVLGGGYALLSNYRQVAPAPPALPEDTAITGDVPDAAPVNSVAPSANPAGVVILTARDTVWLRVYDANNKRLFEKEMAKGERWQVPADANNPMIRTGRADRLQVTIDGKDVPALGPAERTIKDVGVSAKALVARASPGATGPSASSAAPSASRVPTISGQ